ncbi:hypothetical protein ACQ4PT_033817 [Festuca glaucescens]
MACKLIILIPPYILTCALCPDRSGYQRLLLSLGPKTEDVSKPVNPITFFFRFLMGAIFAVYYGLVPIYMWIKDQIVPKGSQSKGWEWELSCSEEWIASI